MKISQIGRQRIPNKWSDETERVLTKRFQVTFWELSKAPRLSIAECVMSDMRRTKLKGKAEECHCRSDCTQKLPSCTRCDNSLAANAVNTGLMWSRLRFFYFLLFFLNIFFLTLFLFLCVVLLVNLLQSIIIIIIIYYNTIREKLYQHSL